MCVCVFLRHALKDPDVSRERRCLQASPQQQTFDKNYKKDKSEFLFWKVREFLGRWSKNSNPAKTQFHTSEVRIQEHKHFAVSFKTFISCYRTSGFRRVSEGESEGVSEGFSKGSRRVLEGF